MKRQLYTLIGIVILMTMTGFIVKAQTSSPRLTANVPFEFSIGKTTFPAGEYEVTCTNPASSAKILEFRQKSGTARVLIQTSDVIASVQENAKLVFHRYGDRYFLSQAWMHGDSNGLAVPKSRDEKNLERRLAGMKPATATVAMNEKH